MGLKRLRKCISALALALAALLFVSPFAAISESAGLEALLKSKLSGISERAEESKAQSVRAQLAGGSQKIVIGVVVEGSAYAIVDGEAVLSGFDVETVSGALNTANYKNHSFIEVEAEQAVALLDSGEIDLLLGFRMSEEELSGIESRVAGDAVSRADLEVEQSVNAQAATVDEAEEIIVAEGKYIRSDAYLSGKDNVKLKDGREKDLGDLEYYVLGRADMAKVVSAFNRAYERYDIAGSRDALWMKYFETGSLFGFTSTVRRWFKNIAREFRINLIEDNRYDMILTGLGRTLFIALMAALIGIVQGCVLALMRLSNAKIGRFHVLRGISSLYVDVIRGTPVVVQLMIMYYIIFASSGFSKISVAVIAFGLNSSAYVSEMVRGGILAVDKGQTEAGRSLGLSAKKTMMLIVLPQAIKIIIPSLFNEIVMLLKETSVVGFIGLMDLTKAGDYIRSRTYSAFFPLLTVAFVYLIVVTGLTRVFNAVERRIRQSDLR